jgi:hypothetical protein
MCKKISLEKATREFINHHSRAHTKDQHQLIPSTSLHSHSSSSCASVPAIMTVDCHHQRRNKAWETWLLKREKKSGERDWGKLQASSSTENTEKNLMVSSLSFKVKNEDSGAYVLDDFYNAQVHALPPPYEHIIIKYTCNGV